MERSGFVVRYTVRSGFVARYTVRKTLNETPPGEHGTGPGSHESDADAPWRPGHQHEDGTGDILCMQPHGLHEAHTWSDMVCPRRGGCPSPVPQMQRHVHAGGEGIQSGVTHVFKTLLRLLQGDEAPRGGDLLLHESQRGFRCDQHSESCSAPIKHSSYYCDMEIKN